MLDRCRRRLFGARADDKGFVLAVFALMLTTLLLFAGFSIDVGAWYSRGSHLQRSADAAALAGVVWMPDIDAARAAATETLRRNGIEADPGEISFSIDPVPGNSQQLSVTVTDHAVDQYFSQLAIDAPSVTRDATAEYVLAVPLGSPRNFLGTGDLATGYNENLWLAVSAWCTNKVDGERHRARFGGVGTGYSPGDCVANPSPANTMLNDEYWPGGYEFYIEAPSTRGYNIDVLLFDPRYDQGGTTLDSNLNSGENSYTYTLYQADNTPLDDTDNPAVPGCSRTYHHDTPQTYGSYLGRTEWDRLCSISASDPSGRYILRVTNGENETSAAGSNTFSIVARPSFGFGPNGLCDGRTDANCPRVYGKESLPAYARQSDSTAEFYLAEVEPIHAGKTMRLTLFDPGEGGNWIESLMPTGASSWTPVNFSWTSDNASHPSGTGTRLSVASDRFNGRTVTIEIPLSGYSPPADNNWWRVRYNFGSSNVTDRTTWSVGIIGDPVHLVD